MDKTEFIKYLSKKNRRSQNIYTEILTEITNGIMDQVARGQSIQLTGFGKFLVTNKNQVTQKSIRTHEIITIPSHKRPHFKAGKVFRDMVNGKKK